MSSSVDQLVHDAVEFALNEMEKGEDKETILEKLPSDIEGEQA